MTSIIKSLQPNLLVWYKKTAHFAGAVLFMLYFTSCQQTSIIGVGVANQGDAQMFQTDTFSIDASTLFVDSIQTDRSRSEFLLVGKYNDPLFGKISATSFVKFIPGIDPVKLPIITSGTDGSTPVTSTMDSVVVILGLQKYQNDPINIYPSHNVTQTFHLHRLNAEVKDAQAYYSVDALAYNPTPLASIVVNVGKLKEDKFLRINLDKIGGAAKILSDSIKLMFTNQVPLATFKDSFKGFALVPDANNIGNVIGFTNDISTSLILHYTASYQQQGGAIPNTNEQKAFLIFAGSHFTRFQADRIGTPLAALTSAWQAIPSKNLGGNSFMQAGLGVYTRLSFPTLVNLKKLGNVVINKAELLLKPAIGSVLNYPTPEVVFMYQAGTNGKIITQTVNSVFQYVRIPFDGTNNTYVGYDSQEEDYEIALSRYAQSIMTGDMKNPYMMVVPANANFTVNRTILNNASNAGPKIRLRVYYTLFK